MSEKLRDYIDRHYDSRETVSLILDALEERLSDIGLTFYIEENLAGLKIVNAEKQSRDWFALMPHFDCDVNPGGEAFWLRGVDDSGETVMTQAARFYRLRRTNLNDELTSMRLFYGSERKTLRFGESIVCTAPSAKRLTGRILCLGSGWVDPEFRGMGFANYVPRLSYLIGLQKWQQDYTISFVEPALVKQKMVAHYGFKNTEPAIHWTNPPDLDGDLDLHLIWMDQAELHRDLADSLKLAVSTRKKVARKSTEQVAHL